MYGSTTRCPVMRSSVKWTDAHRPQKLPIAGECFTDSARYSQAQRVSLLPFVRHAVGSRLPKESRMIKLTTYARYAGVTILVTIK